MKKCKSCGETKSLGAFGLAYNVKLRPTRRLTCEACMELIRLRQAKARRASTLVRHAQLGFLFRSLPCRFCGKPATSKLPSGLYKGWDVCDRLQCGWQQLKPANIVAFIRKVA